MIIIYSICPVYDYYNRSKSGYSLLVPKHGIKKGYFPMYYVIFVMDGP